MSNETWKARELEILQLLAQGLTNREIAARLHLSQETVRWYNKQIFVKLGAANRTQAVQRASEQNLLKGAALSQSKGRERSAASKKSQRSPVRYVRNGAVHLAYQTIGDGPVDLLFIHGFLSNLELAWESPEYTNFFEELAQFARVILFDKRGMGLSDRIQGAPSLEDTMSDALCVLDAAASERIFVLGTSEGGAAALLLSSTHPERVRGLILYSTTPKLVQTNGEPDWAKNEEAFENSIERIQKQWGGAWALENFAPSRAGDEDFRAWWAKVLRSSSSPASVSAQFRVLRDIDVRPLLPQIHTRTLVIHKTHDRILTVEASRYLASCLPNAQWAELPGADHFFFVESAQLLSAVSQFLREEPESSTDTWIGIVLYLRLPNMKQKAIRVKLKEHRAKGMFFSADEATAVFDGPSRAIQCALKLRETLKDDTLKISLHVGECNVGNGKPTHAVMDTARRAAEFAPQGKILLTQTLRDILAGSGVVFDLRQIHIDKKKPERVSFYALS